MQYQVTLTEDQLQLISRALEFYSRIHLGQFEVVVELFRFRDGMDYDKFDSGRYALDLAKRLLTGNPPNGSWGIYSPEVAEEGKRSFDMHRDIRHRLAWDRNPEGGITVDFDDPRFLVASQNYTHLSIERLDSDVQICGQAGEKAGKAGE